MQAKAQPSLQKGASGVGGLVAGTDDDGFHFSDAGNRAMAKLLSEIIIQFVDNPDAFVKGGKR